MNHDITRTVFSLEQVCDAPNCKYAER